MPGSTIGKKSKRHRLIPRPGGSPWLRGGAWPSLLLLWVGVLAGCGGGLSPATESSLRPPSAAIATGVYTGTTGTAVQFSAAGSSDPQGQPLSYAWNFGDNIAGTGVSTTHTYAAPGTYTVTLTVTDASNLSATATGKANIAAAVQASLATGAVYGGQQPVSGATVQLWQVGTAGYGVGAAPLGSSTLTGGDGTFNLTGKYSCANAANGGNTLVYITASGGNPGLTSGTNNTALILMSALGPCSNLTPSTFISINEVTTVASVYALSQFMGPSGSVGSFGSANQGLVNAFATVNNLVNTATGMALATTPNGNGIVPQAEINTLADILAPCVNSTGPSSGDCSSLFSAATPAGGSAPSTMLAAALNVAQNPGNNVAALLVLPTPAAPFQPTLSSANDWTIALSFASGGASPKSLALDGSGNVWIANYGTGGPTSSVSMITPLGVPAVNSPFSGASYVNGVAALAVDANNNVWLANQDNNSAMELNATLNGPTVSIAAVSGPFGAIGLSSPNAVAVDPSSNIWFANNGNDSVTEMPNAGCANPQCVTIYTGGGLNRPAGIALDSSGVAWVANTSGGSVTRIDSAVPPASYTGGGITNPAAIAIDGASNVWVTDSMLGQLSKLSGVGAAISPGSGYSGGGVTGSNADAIDGSGNVWAADASGNRISELSSSGKVLTPAAGYQGGSLSAPDSLAIDASGNIWVANGTPATSGPLSLTISEFIGMAAPANMPLAQAVKTAVIGQEPGTAPVPKAPLAIAGGVYAGMAGAALNFSGAGSVDPKQEGLTYTWNFGDGSGGSGTTPVHSYFSAGTYPVSLTVTNADGLQSAASTTTATIAPLPAQAPVANAGGPYSGTAYSAVSFNGTASSDPANIAAGALALGLTWSFGDGSQAVGPTPVHTYSGPGTYTVSLTAQSATGTTALATTSATIAAGTAPTGAPTANPGGPYTGSANSAVALNGGGSSDPHGLALTYTWDFGDGAGSNLSNPTHAYAQGGSYSVLLAVSNGTNQSTAGTVATIAAAALAHLVANAGGPYNVAMTQPLTLNGTNSTDPSGRQLIYTWDFGDGTTGSGSNPIHIYAQRGSYTVNLSVNDGATENGNATAQVTVTGLPAEAVASTAGGPYQDVTGHGIVFNASASSDNLGNPLTYSWNFGDGSTASGATPTHAYAAVGSYTATVTAGSGTASSTATAKVTISAVVSVAVTSPTPNAIFATNTVTVAGTASEPNLTVTVNGIPATVSGTSFTASGVSLREGVNLITATASDNNGGIGSGVVSVILDVTPPAVSITSPLSGATVTTSSIAVAGLVNDIVTGTVGSNDVTVTVNGNPAQVSNRSYLLSSLQLAPGLNTITVVATDKVGNQGQTTGTVQLLPASSQLSLIKLSGDAQTGAVQTVLPQALSVQLVSASGTPVAGRPITFTVTRSDGMVEVMPTLAQNLAVTTDSTGKASVLFQLGSRSGLGINQVSATTPGAAGAAVFTATSTVGLPTQIHSVNGDNQRGLLGEPLAQAFQVIVEDAKGNPVPGATVNYTSVGAGDGSLDHASPVTDGNGKAIATLTLGQQEGISNYAVSADFAGDTGNPVNFLASAYAPGPMANTSVSGVVLDNTNTPVQNATVTIQGTALSTVTNASGTFQINGAPVGTVTLTVDGSTAVSAETLPFLSFVLQDLPGQNNSLGKPIYLPSIDVNNAQTVGGNDPVTLTMAGVPGVAFTVAPNSVTFPDGSTVGKLSLSQVKSDLVPMEPSNGTAPNLLWTLQPAGTKFSVPIQVTLPNSQGLPPGYVSEMYQYDHDLEQFVSAGTGHVSADGSVIVSDPGFGITKAGWGHGGSPNVPGGCVTSCKSTNPCFSAMLSPSGCLCYTKPIPGATCGKPNTAFLGATNSCLLQGVCDQFGNCSGTKVKQGTPCSPKPDFCDISAECSGTGVCVSTGRIPDMIQHQINGGGPDSITAKQTLTSAFGPAQNWLKKIGLNQVGVTVDFTDSLTNTFTCCSATQVPNALITDDSSTPSFTVSSPKLPVIIGAVPLAIELPNGDVFGAYAQVSGTFALTYTHHDNTCTGQNCATVKWNPALTLTFGLNFPNGIIDLNANLSGGFQFNFGGGCSSITFEVSSLPILATGSVQLFTGTTFSITATIYPSEVIFGGTYTFPPGP